MARIENRNELNPNGIAIIFVIVGTTANLIGYSSMVSHD